MDFWNTIDSDLLTSWKAWEGLHRTADLLTWISERNESLEVEISSIGLEECFPWLYDPVSGVIRNKDRSFFCIQGIRTSPAAGQTLEQPILIQDEIGFLGIICSKIDGVLHFLMQAKIEPGNVNKIQISPTIQATKSNFERKHGGKRPEFLDQFLDASHGQVWVDQLQSEQSSRFLRKRNRNVILVADEPLDERPTHRWMTLGQIKTLLRHDNLVNMDTRTVLSCIPAARCIRSDVGSRIDAALLESMTAVPDRRTLAAIYHDLNDFKMFSGSRTQLVDLFSLESWHMEDHAFRCKRPHPFEVIFCEISIEGREVRRWKQPLFKANGKALFGLLCRIDEGRMQFLVRGCPEIGCFDRIELGPTVQQDVLDGEKDDEVTGYLKRRLELGLGILVDVTLSEEGGRFFHEENRNVLVLADESDFLKAPHGYYWCDYGTLNSLIQINNCANIQLRNLLSLLDFTKD